MFLNVQKTVHCNKTCYSLFSFCVNTLWLFLSTQHGITILNLKMKITPKKTLCCIGSHFRPESYFASGFLYLFRFFFFNKELDQRLCIKGEKQHYSIIFVLPFRKVSSLIQGPFKEKGKERKKCSLELGTIELIHFNHHQLSS